ncbi:MAG: MFS transporter [Planctomycetota bacterium]|jgi:MFS family permease
MLFLPMSPRAKTESAANGPPLWLLGLLAIGIMIPVTMPVPVLRGLVQDRFQVTVFWTSLFMSVNMLGAVLTAPMVGALADRLGRRSHIIVAALAFDAVCLFALTLQVPFWAFLMIRFLEGCAHITALSLILSMAASLAGTLGSGRSMGIVGAGLTLGVAVGAPIGGLLGRTDPLQPLVVGAGISLVLSLTSFLFLSGVGTGAARPKMGDILAMARRETSLLLPYAFAFVDRFTVGFFTTTFTLWMKEVHDLSSERIGLLLGLFLGPFSLLSYFFGRLSDRVSRTSLLAGGSLVYGLGVMSMGLWSPEHYPWVMLSLGTAAAVMFVPSLILTTNLAGKEIRSTALGGFNAAGSMGFILGPVVGGAVSQAVAAESDWQTGYSTAFLVAGLSQVVCVVLTWRGLRRLVSAGRTS